MAHRFGLAVSDLHVVISQKPVLSGVSHRFPTGVTAVLGPNGAGKSTLLRVLVGIQRPTNGSMLFDDDDVFDHDSALDRFRRRVGWLPQEPGFPPRVTAEQLVAHAAWLRIVPPGEVDTAVARSLSLADVSDLASTRLGRLSGGQRRRVALAAALVGDPDVIVVDEPTVGLDPDQRQRFLERLRRLSDDRVVVMATHILDDVEHGADRWCTIGNGRKVAEGDVDRSSPATLATGVASALASFRIVSSPSNEARE